MKLHIPTLIAGVDARIEAVKAATDAANAESAKRNAEVEATWAPMREQLVTATKDFAKRVASKSFDGDTARAEREALAAAGLDRGYSWNTFHNVTRPKLALTDRQPDLTELHGLRELLTTSSHDDEYVSVSLLERLGVKSAQLTHLYRAVYAARAGAK